jgi:hypothetical protein
MHKEKQMEKYCPLYAMQTTRPGLRLWMQAKQNAPASLHFALCLVGLHNCNKAKSHISIILFGPLKHDWLRKCFPKQKIRTCAIATLTYKNLSMINVKVLHWQ